jgi:uncharacterized protein YjbJ (UPF0337 family)
MKRLLTAALVAGVFSVFGLTGCGEKSEVKQTETVSTPGGSTTTETTKEIKSTGDNPPPNSAGEKVEPPSDRHGTCAVPPVEGGPGASRFLVVVADFQGRERERLSIWHRDCFDRGTNTRPGRRVAGTTKQRQHKDPNLGSAREFSTMAINAQELQGQWNTLRGRVRERWGQLTDDDLQMQGGNVDQLVGRIQQKTGETRDTIERYLNDLTARGGSAVAQASEAIGQYAQQAGDRLRERYGEFADQARERFDSARDMVRENPSQSLAAAFGVGLLAGLIVGLALRSR